MQFQIFKKMKQQSKNAYFLCYLGNEKSYPRSACGKTTKVLLQFQTLIILEKIECMQPVWLCMHWSKCFEDTSENAQWTKSSKCNQYNFQSFRSDNLRIHLKTHRGEKPNKCNQCDYACSDPSALRTHLKTHIGEKFYKCNQCNYAPP